MVDLADAALSGAVGMLRFPHAPYSDYFFWATFSVVRVVVDQL